MPSDHYNPCIDGFTAKAWECLRRNKEFQESTGGHADFDRYGNFEGYTFNSDLEEDMHPFHRVALVMINGYDPLLSDDTLKSCTLSTSWKELSADFRERLNWTLMRHMPECFSVPDLNTINPFACDKSYSESKSRDFFWELNEYLTAHRLIAVPGFVWDTAHQKAIGREVKKLLSKPKGKVKQLKPTGSTLGTKAQWNSYLLYEEWTRAGYGQGRAVGLASWELYEKKKGKRDFGNDSKARIQAAKAFLDSPAGKQEPDQKYTVEQHIGYIEKAIASVYPTYAPF